MLSVRRYDSGMSPGDAVLVWSGPISCGARVLDWAPPTAAVHGQTNHVWLDVCILGQHLPQSYVIGEVSPLDAELAPQLGLCVTCLGYGTADPAPVALAAGVDHIRNPCEECRGSGRPAIRVTVTRTSDSIHGNLAVLDHVVVMLKGGTTCLACGLAPDEPAALHVVAKSELA